APRSSHVRILICARASGSRSRAVRSRVSRGSSSPPIGRPAPSSFRSISSAGASRSRWTARSRCRPEPLMETTTRHDSLERLRGLWRRRRFPAFAVFALVLAAAAGIVLGLPPVYQAEAKILVDRASLPASVAAPSTTEEIEAKIGALGEETMSRARLSELIGRYHLYPTLDKLAEDDVVKRMRHDILLGLDHASPTGNAA